MLADSFSSTLKQHYVSDGSMGSIEESLLRRSKDSYFSVFIVYCLYLDCCVSGEILWDMLALSRE